MAKLSLYSNTTQVKQIKPWNYWTDQQKCWVVYRAFELQYLKSKQIQDYLWSSRLNTITTFAFPVLSAGLFSLLNSSRTRFTRKFGNSYLPLFGFVATTTLLWLNLSPFYTFKEKKQQILLDTLYDRLSSSMSILNDVIPRFTTTNDIDRKTRRLYNQRNSIFTNYLFPPEQQIAPLVEMKNIVKYRKKLMK